MSEYTKYIPYVGTVEALYNLGTSKEAKDLYKLADPLGKDIVDNLKVKVNEMSIHANNYEACIEKVQNMIKEKGK